MADRTPGVAGRDPFAQAPDPNGPGESPGAGFADLGPNGLNAPIPLVARIIAKVDDDWHPAAPNEDPTVSIEADTLADVGKLLPKGEWGQGGGSLRSDAIPVGTSTNLTVTLHGNLIRRLPEWTNASAASAPARREWERMLSKLKAHEQRHMDIAIDHGNELAKELIGKDIDQISKLVTARNALIAKDQKQLDDDTNNGSKPGVPYGDVFLDTSIQ